MCHMLAKKMEENNVPFERCMDIDEMEKKGITHVPILETDDGQMLSLAEALQYIAKGIQ